MIQNNGWIPGVGAFAITVAALLALRPIAYAVDLVDRPGGRKTHHGVVPVVGGLGMLLGLVFGLVSHGGAIGTLQSYLFSAVLLAVVGLLDDRFTLAPRLRLLAQFCAVMPMFFGAGVRMTSFGDLFGLGPIDVHGWSLASTAIVAIAAINAFNMLDGIDGLAGGIVFVAAALALELTGIASHPTSARLLTVLIGSIAGFLLFNAPVHWNRRFRCFMGDAGSTLLGFSLAWVMIELSQGPSPIAAPVTMVWFVSVPSADLVFSVLRRTWHRQSPLHADNEHLHHQFLRAGLGVRSVFALLIMLAVAGGLLGGVLERAHVPQWVSFALLLIWGAGLVALGRSAPGWFHLVPPAFRRVDRRRERNTTPVA